MGSAESKCEKDRSDKLEPILSAPTTGNRNTGPIRTRPKIGTGNPGQAELWHNGEKPIVVKSKADRMRPIQPKLWRNKRKSNLTVSITGREKTKPDQDKPKTEAMDSGRPKL